MTDNNLEVSLQKFDQKDYMFKFNVKKRVGSFNIEGINHINGESIFGPVETWPAQLQGFVGYVAEQVKKDKIKLNDLTFSKNNLINLLENYRGSLFKRNYISEKEVVSTFIEVVKYLELGIIIGSIEKSISEKFQELPSFKQIYFKAFKRVGRKYIDDICEDMGHNKKIENIDNLSPSYIKLHVLKYEVLDKS